MAVPSARNSGFERMMKVCLWWVCSTAAIASAVRTGRVDFSTTILSPFASWEIMRAAASQYCKSEA